MTNKKLKLRSDKKKKTLSKAQERITPDYSMCLPKQLIVDGMSNGEELYQNKKEEKS